MEREEGDRWLLYEPITKWGTSTQSSPVQPSGTCEAVSDGGISRTGWAAGTGCHTHGPSP